ncbi:MAG: hypothetical protein FWH51_03025 [Dehalococcoidia bacterium]|nr:hypothetical protein [Dehalococcoidia bacterium]
MPEDFYIIYERDFASGPLLDTSRNILGTTLSNWEYVFVKYVMPCENLQAIYDAIIEHDIKSYNGMKLINKDGPVRIPSITYAVTFCLDGETCSIRYNEDITYAEYPNVRAFHNILDSYYKNTDEYRAFPPDRPMLT